MFGLLVIDKLYIYVGDVDIYNFNMGVCVMDVFLKMVINLSFQGFIIYQLMVLYCWGLLGEVFYDIMICFMQQYVFKGDVVWIY